MFGHVTHVHVRVERYKMEVVPNTLGLEPNVIAVKTSPVIHLNHLRLGSSFVENKFQLPRFSSGPK